jgi:transposase
MINNFGKKFGSKEDVIFVVGDYDKGNNHMKGVEPVINKKFRRIFRNAGYQTFLINEFKTSKLCNCCHNELEKFMIRQSNKPRDKKANKKCLVNGLLHHDKDVKPKCEIVHNRDKNAVQNMLNIITSLKTTGLRPKIFSREEKEKVEPVKNKTVKKKVKKVT